MDRDTVTKTYGRGSFLAFLSPLLAFFMARQRMHGWEQHAAQDVQRDVLSMADRGYVVASAEEFRLPLLGVSWFKVVYRQSPHRT